MSPPEFSPVFYLWPAGQCFSTHGSRPHCQISYKLGIRTVIHNSSKITVMMQQQNNLTVGGHHHMRSPIKGAQH